MGNGPGGRVVADCDVRGELMLQEVVAEESLLDLGVSFLSSIPQQGLPPVAMTPVGGGVAPVDSVAVLFSQRFKRRHQGRVAAVSLHASQEIQHILCCRVPRKLQEIQGIKRRIRRLEKLIPQLRRMTEN